MRRPYAVGAALVCVLALAPAGSIAEPGPSAGELSAATAAQGLLPSEILEFYKKGEWKSAIVEWPNGKIRHDKESRRGVAATPIISCSMPTTASSTRPAPRSRRRSSAYFGLRRGSSVAMHREFAKV